MEDWNMLTADCVVVSCCCQCLVLQILVLLLRKIVRTTKEFGKKIFCQGKGNYRGVQREIHKNSFKDVILRIHEDMELKDDDDAHNCSCCMVEVEKVMEELCERGEFAFGSFWGRKEPWGFHEVVNDHNDDSFGRYQIIELGDG